MACEVDKFVGREVALEFHIGCPDVFPGPGDWLPLGAVRTKEISNEWDSVDATADDSVGNVRNSLATYLTYGISADGVCKRADDTLSNQTALYKHFKNPTLTGGQPVAWFRVTTPDVTETGFMLMTTFSRSFPFDDVCTYSLEATATESPFGVIVEDTPVV